MSGLAFAIFCVVSIVAVGLSSKPKCDEGDNTKQNSTSPNNEKKKEMKKFFMQHSLFLKRLSFATVTWFILVFGYCWIFEPSYRPYFGEDYIVRIVQKRGPDGMDFNIRFLKIFLGPPFFTWIIAFMWLKFWPKN